MNAPTSRHLHRWLSILTTIRPLGRRKTTTGEAWSGVITAKKGVGLGLGLVWLVVTIPDRRFACEMPFGEFQDLDPKSTGVLMAGDIQHAIETASYLIQTRLNPDRQPPYDIPFAAELVTADFSGNNHYQKFHIVLAVVEAKGKRTRGEGNNTWGQYNL
ncbi:hypothetical protein DPMN_185008 [Dreissena polymorpha]|uniref:Uncharacterized protein n=1 Tax=Dreissena polymorpha TaxID=45954 RepID=A0A9D4DLD7_DREPO|nr:hypothetical protein DPMN_185008 [Dreissena polymorpha]